MLRVVPQIVPIILLAGVAWGAEPAPSSTRQLIGGIGLGDSQTHVSKVLGLPTRVEKTGDLLDPVWHYKYLSVAFYGDTHKVGQIEASGTSYCTALGVCPGDSAAHALQVMGRPTDAVKLTDGAHSYHTEEPTCWLEVVVLSEVIKSLALRCQV